MDDDFAGADRGAHALFDFVCDLVRGLDVEVAGDGDGQLDEDLALAATRSDVVAVGDAGRVEREAPDRAGLDRAFVDEDGYRRAEDAPPGPGDHGRDDEGDEGV